MNDITKCKGFCEKTQQECPIRQVCERNRIDESDPIWQSWFMDLPYNFKTFRCPEYLKGIQHK